MAKRPASSRDDYLTMMEKVENAFAEKTPAHFDIVESTVVQAFIDDDYRLETVEIDFQCNLDDILQNARLRIAELKGLDKDFDGEEALLRAEINATIQACSVIYVDNPSLCIAWMIKSGRYHLMHKVIMSAGITGHYPKVGD